MLISDYFEHFHTKEYAVVVVTHFSNHHDNSEAIKNSLADFNRLRGMLQSILHNYPQ